MFRKDVVATSLVLDTVVALFSAVYLFAFFPKSLNPYDISILVYFLLLGVVVVFFGITEILSCIAYPKDNYQDYINLKIPLVIGLVVLGVVNFFVYQFGLFFLFLITKVIGDYWSLKIHSEFDSNSTNWFKIFGYAILVLIAVVFFL